MTNDPTEEQQPALIKVAVRGSRFSHYAVNGHHLTLCARVAEYRLRFQPPRDYCARCTSEASRRGWTIRP